MMLYHNIFLWSFKARKIFVLALKFLTTLIFNIVINSLMGYVIRINTQFGGHINYRF